MYLADRMSVHSFVDAFRQSAERKEEFSYEALRALFEQLDDDAAGMEQPLEFDMVAICCEWSEMTRKEILEEYDVSEPEHLEDRTYIIPVYKNNLYPTLISYLIQEF